MNKEFQQEIGAYLRLVDDEAKPLAGTDITGRNQHQYTRLALISLPPGSYGFNKVNKERVFVVFAESSWLFEALHERLKTPDWIKEGFDNKYMFIEEILHKPRAGDTLNEYTTYIAQNENDLWLALFNFAIAQGILERSARKMISKTYRLPDTEQSTSGL